MIKNLALRLDHELEITASREYYSAFFFKCRFIGNYLLRKIKENKIHSTDYNRLFIEAGVNNDKPSYVFDHSLVVSIPFDIAAYDNLSKEELPDYFIQLYKEGIIKASQSHEIPLAFLLTKLIEFKDNDYLNEWEFKSKSFKEIGIKAVLNCKMTIDFFSLTLVLKKKDEIVFSKEILSTLPDEIIYHWQFKEIALEGNEIKVLDQFKKPICLLDLTFKA